jgi:hypothetical protein
MPDTLRLFSAAIIFLLLFIHQPTNLTAQSVQSPTVDLEIVEKIKQEGIERSQENEALRLLFRTWLQPFADWDATTVSYRNTGSTDHVSFDRVGLPGF